MPKKGLELTKEQITTYCKKHGFSLPDGLSPNSKPQRHPGNESVGKAKTQEGNPRRCIVRVTSYRNRLLDEDNLIPKWHIDALRYAGCLRSDAPDKTHIVTTQKKVAKKDQEKTLIEICL